jgi:NADH-quinone oxidoreductase subunit J
MTNDHWWVGLGTALLLEAVMGYSLIDRWGDDALPADRQVNSVAGSNTATVSDSIFSQYLIPFEIVSVLLLAALVGAIVIARKDR